MDLDITRLATRFAYASGQLPRRAWYAGHFYIMRRLAQQAQLREGSGRSDSEARLEQRLSSDIAELMQRDLANVETGIYPVPSDGDGSFLTVLRRSRLFFQDLPEIHQRRKRNGTHEVLSGSVLGRRPDYYLQNFHYQSGGWETADSAERYDTQVEVLFKGTANMMRRQALPPLAETFAGRDQRKMRLIDIGCGTGRFINCVKQAWPRLPVTGIDLSEAYVTHARRHLQRWSRTNVLVANGEAIPASDSCYDAATCIFLMHELPPEARRNLVAEAARVLKPGGRLIIIDSHQLGDVPEYDRMLESFPTNYHEPYFNTYVREDFPSLASAYGLVHRGDSPAFLSKVMKFDKH